jgi:hypothetical protein
LLGNFGLGGLLLEDGFGDLGSHGDDSYFRGVRKR